MKTYEECRAEINGRVRIALDNCKSDHTTDRLAFECGVLMEIAVSNAYELELMKATTEPKPDKRK